MPWLITGCIALFLAFLLAARLKVVVTYDDDFRYSFRYLFITVRMKGKEKGKDKETQEAKKPKQDIGQFLRLFKKFYTRIVEAVKAVLKRLRIDSLRLRLAIREEDAAQTAILYGEACAVVYTAAGFLSSAVRVKKRDIRIQPLFNGGESAIEFECVASMRLGSVLFVLLTQSAILITAMVKDTMSKKQVKDGALK